MSRVLSSFAIVLLFLAVIGCGREQQSPDKGPNALANTANRAKLPLIERLDPTGVLIRVGKNVITKGDYDALEDLRCRAWAASRGVKWSLENEEARRYRINMKMRNIGALVRGEMLSQYAVELGVKASPEAIRRSEGLFLAELNRPKGNFEKEAKKLGVGCLETARKVVLQDALATEILKRVSSNDFEHVSAQELTNRIEYVRNWNLEADRKNEAARQKASAAKERILKELNFAKVARESAEFCPEQGTSWETVSLDELEADDPLAQWLMTAKVGDISDPLDLEDGISIVGLLQKIESAASEEGKAPVYDFQLVRCAFYAYDKLEVIEDEKLLVKDILASRRQVAMEELRQKLAEKYVIDFPNGNNFFYGKGRRHGNAKTKAKAKVRPKKSVEKQNLINKKQTPGKGESK